MRKTKLRLSNMRAEAYSAGNEPAPCFVTMNSQHAAAGELRAANWGCVIVYLSERASWLVEGALRAVACGWQAPSSAMRSFVAEKRSPSCRSLFVSCVNSV